MTQVQLNNGQIIDCSNNREYQLINQFKEKYPNATFRGWRYKTGCTNDNDFKVGNFIGPNESNTFCHSLLKSAVIDKPLTDSGSVSIFTYGYGVIVDSNQTMYQKDVLWYEFTQSGSMLNYQNFEIYSNCITFSNMDPNSFYFVDSLEITFDF